MDYFIADSIVGMPATSRSSSSFTMGSIASQAPGGTAGGLDQQLHEMGERFDLGVRLRERRGAQGAAGKALANRAYSSAESGSTEPWRNLKGNVKPSAGVKRPPARSRVTNGW